MKHEVRAQALHRTAGATTNQDSLASKCRSYAGSAERHEWSLGQVHKGASCQRAAPRSQAVAHRNAACAARLRRQRPSPSHNGRGSVCCSPNAPTQRHRSLRNPWRCLTLRCSRLATAGFASLRERLSSNVSRHRIRLMRASRYRDLGHARFAKYDMFSEPLSKPIR